MLGPKAAEIRQMFTAIAHRYDFLNHLLSLNIDRIWRRKAVQLLKEPLGQSKALCLDLCCGTGDLSFAMRARGAARIVGSDFSHAMLQRNQEKIRQRGLESGIFIVEADALSLPFKSDSFDGLAIAFGLRNLESVQCGVNGNAPRLETRRQAGGAGIFALDSAFAGPSFSVLLSPYSAANRSPILKTSFRLLLPACFGSSIS